MNKEQILKKVESLVRPQYAKIERWPHGWFHVEKVVQHAKELARMEGADPFLCQIAAYCHDLGRVVEEEKKLYSPVPGAPGHAGLSVIPTQKILDEVVITGKDADKVIEAVKVHQLKKYQGDNEVALILQDADRKNGLGKWGAVRAMVFNLEMDIPKPEDKDLNSVIDSNIKIIKTNPELKEKFIKNSLFALTWYEKLLNTKSAVSYLKEDYLVTKNLYNRVKNN